MIEITVEICEAFKVIGIDISEEGLRKFEKALYERGLNVAPRSLSKQWKCLCGEWVDAKYPTHTHASIKQWFDGREYHNTIGQQPELWTYSREE